MTSKYKKRGRRRDNFGTYYHSPVARFIKTGIPKNEFVISTSLSSSWRRRLTGRR